MAESFLHLPDSDRREIYAAAADQLGRAPVVLEKDVWVCWSLGVLFGAADRRQMAFKGGTALSKAHRVIDRFSEDIDVTVQVPGAAILDEDDLPGRSTRPARPNGSLATGMTWLSSPSTASPHSPSSDVINCTASSRSRTCSTSARHRTTRPVSRTVCAWCPTPDASPISAMTTQR